MAQIEKQEAQINETALQNLVGKMVGDLGAVVSGALVVLGDRLERVLKMSHFNFNVIVQGGRIL